MKKEKALSSVWRSFIVTLSSLPRVCEPCCEQIRTECWGGVPHTLECWLSRGRQVQPREVSESSYMKIQRESLPYVCM